MPNSIPTQNTPVAVSYQSYTAQQRQIAQGLLAQHNSNQQVNGGKGPHPLIIAAATEQPIIIGGKPAKALHQHQHIAPLGTPLTDPICQTVITKEQIDADMVNFTPSGQPVHKVCENNAKDQIDNPTAQNTMQMLNTIPVGVVLATDDESGLLGPMPLAPPVDPDALTLDLIHPEEGPVE